MSTRIFPITLLSAAWLGSCSSSPAERPGQCHPCTVSAKVGPLLKDAQTLLLAKDYKGATAKLDEAETAQHYADDEKVINQMRHAVLVMKTANGRD